MAEIGPVDFTIEEGDLSSLSLRASREEVGAVVVAAGDNPALADLAEGMELKKIDGEGVFDVPLSAIQERIAGSSLPITLTFGPKEEFKPRKLPIPLPEDFFPVRRLTTEEEEELKEQAHGWVPGLLSAEKGTEEDGWRYVKTKAGVAIYQGEVEGSPLKLIRGTTEIHGVPREVIEGAMLMGSTRMFRFGFKRLDIMFEDGLNLFNIPYGTVATTMPAYCVKYGSFKVPMPLQNRDFVWMEYNDQIMDGDTEVAFGCGGSIELDFVPKLSDCGRVRGSILSSGYVFRPIEGENNWKATYLVQVDAAGWVPTWLQNLVAADQADNIGRLRDWMVLRTQAHARLYSNDALAGFNLWDLDVAARSSEEDEFVVPAGGARVVVGLATLEKDIGFHIRNAPGSSRFSSMERYKTDEETLFVDEELPEGSYSLVFDNGYSWMSAKRVYYVIAIHPNEAAPAAVEE